MSETLVPVTHSVFAPDALCAMIVHQYALAAPLTCRLHRVSWNNTYLLATRTDRFVVRVYGARWRSRAAITYALDSLPQRGATSQHPSHAPIEP